MHALNTFVQAGQRVVVQLRGEKRLKMLRRHIAELKSGKKELSEIGRLVPVAAKDSALQTITRCCKGARIVSEVEQSGAGAFTANTITPPSL